MRLDRADFSATSRFDVRRRLGEGAFGAVYEAYDNELRIPVALKRLHEREASALLHFKQEFRSLAEVSHPNLVQLHALPVSDQEAIFTEAAAIFAFFGENSRARRAATWAARCGWCGLG